MRSRLSACLAVGFLALATASCIDAGDDEANENTLVEDITIPAPTLSATVISCTSLELNWTTVAGATKYVLYKGTATGNETTYTSVPATPTSFGEGHQSAGQTLSYEIRAAIGNSGSPFSNEVLVTMPPCNVPGTPQDVTATALSSAKINVTWDAVTGAAKYFVFMSQGSGAFSLAGSVVAPTTNLTVGGLAAATTYNFEITAVDSANNQSADSAIASATTFGSVVGGLEGYWAFDEHGGTTATDTSGFSRNGTLQGTETEAFTLPKAPIDGNKSFVQGGAATAFVSVPNATAFNLVNTNWSVVFWARIPTALTSTTRFVGIRNVSCGSVGWEIAQDSVGLHILGQSQLNFSASLNPGDWTHVGVSYNNGTATLYINGVQTATGAFSVTNHPAIPLQIGNAGSCAQGGTVQVDELQIYSLSLTSTQIAALGKLPAAPTGVQVAVNGSTGETLTWTAVPSATKYYVNVGSGSGSGGSGAGNEVFLTSVPASPQSYADGHLVPSTQYSWTVQAIVNRLISKASAEASATTNAGIAAPTNVAATALSTTQIKLTWTAATGAVKYYVLRSTSGGAFTFLTTVTPGSAITYTDSGLTTATAYSYELASGDSANNTSAPSAPASATTN